MDQVWTISAAQSLVTLSQNGNPEPLTVYNAGPSDALVTQDEAATSPGFPLPVGASIVWDAGRPLCALVPVGTTVLNVLANSGPLLTPETFAQALILSNFAQAVASDISISGAPPINSFTSVFSGTCTDAGTVQGPADVSAFQSLDIIMFENNVGGFAVPLPRSVVLLWDNGLQDIVNLTDSNGVISVLPGLHVSVPVRSPHVTFVVNSNGRAGTVSFFVRGSYRTQTSLTYQLQSSYWGKSGLAFFGTAAEGWQGLSGVKGASTLNDYPSVTAGTVTMTASSGAVTGNPLSISVLDLASAIVLAQVSFPVGAGGTVEQEFQAGNRPLQLQIGPPSAASALVRVSLSSVEG